MSSRMTKEQMRNLTPNDFENPKEIGKGAYGTVYLVRCKIDGMEYVMKKMKLNEMKAK